MTWLLAVLLQAGALQAGSVAAPCPSAGAFTQTQTLPELSRPLISQGRFIVQCKRGFIWQTVHPIEETLLFRRDADQLLRFENGAVEVLDNRPARELNRILNGIVSGDVTYLERQFERSQDEAGIRLVPRDRRLAKFLKAIRIQPLGERESLITIERGNGGETRIAVAHGDPAPATDLQACQASVTPAACAQLFPSH